MSGNLDLGPGMDCENIRRELESCGFHTILLLEDKATMFEVSRGLDQVKSAVNEFLAGSTSLLHRPVVLFFFAGHGAVIKGDMSIALAQVDF